MGTSRAKGTWSNLIDVSLIASRERGGLNRDEAPPWVGYPGHRDTHSPVPGLGTLLQPCQLVRGATRLLALPLSAALADAPLEPGVSGRAELKVAAQQMSSC